MQFYVENELYKTLKVEDGKKIDISLIDAPVLSGFEFVSWQDSAKKDVDFASFEVKQATKLYASFKEIITDETLVVDAVKEEGKSYYLVVGWWETTALEADGVTPKITSSLDTDTVRTFYANLNLYLKAYGATDEQIKNVQFRNYSTEKVAEMGAKINADGDVDLVIGVGNNINSSAGVSLFEGNDGKQTAKMGTQALSRYVALPNHENMNNVAISIFDWIKTEVGQKAFTTTLKADEIVVAPERTDEINVNVKISSGDGTFTETTLTNKNDAIMVPTYTISEGYKFLGYAVAENETTPAIIKTNGEALSYDEIEKLLNGALSLVLYPVIIEDVVATDYDLVVYIHVAGSVKINLAEVELLKLRFESTLTEEKNINYVVVENVDAAGFLARINEDLGKGEAIDVVIGGNATTKNLTAYDDATVNTSCNTHHFDNDSRKVIVLKQANENNITLAKALYNFLVSDAPVYTLHVAFWTKAYAWVSEAEIATIKEGIDALLKAKLESTTTLSESHNVSVTYYESTKEKVAEISVETKSFNNSLGVGLIVGTGGNATNAEHMGSDILEQKDCPITIVAASRKVSILENSYFYQALYNEYFVIPA